MNGYSKTLAWRKARLLPPPSAPATLPGMTPHDPTRRVGGPTLTIQVAAPHADQVDNLWPDELATLEELERVGAVIYSTVQK